ncbi:uncharacterized protein LOC135383350 [Ornithodoros turicata]|uniref:uncharacterized protein LOC135383350 n=1 Tax=Ornithodoros turicata TaxID=34597 RepID=UPI003139ACEA
MIVLLVLGIALMAVGGGGMHTQRALLVEEDPVTAMMTAATRVHLTFPMTLAVVVPPAVIVSHRFRHQRHPRFKAVQKSKNPDYGSVVIGIRGKYGLAPSFGSWIQAVKDKGYDIIVLHTHISSWNVTAMTGTSGASIWTSTTYVYASMMNAIGALSPTAFSTNATVMLSLTMGVQTFQMKKTDGVTQLNIKPLSATMSTFAETCASGLTAKTEDPNSHFMITGSTTTHVQYIYDSSETIKTKGNLAKAEIGKKAIKVKRGWAIFDVELDDPVNFCKKSRSFDRLIEVATALGKTR